MAEKYYKVAESDLVAIADRTRTMAGTTKGMTLEDIIYWLGRVIYIPQARGMTEYTWNNYSTSGVTILPDVQRTSGLTEYTWNDYSTSATGELVVSE